MRCTSLAATATDITFLCGAGLRVPLEPIIADFEKSSGNNVVVRWQVINVIADSVMKGEAADLVTVSDQQWQELSGAGKVDPAVRFVIAKSGYGVFVKKGAGKPDISSVAALKRTLLGASSVALFDTTSGGPTAIGTKKLLDQLDITAEVQRKAEYLSTAYGRVSAPLIFETVANGGAENLRRTHSRWNQRSRRRHGRTRPCRGAALHRDRLYNGHTGQRKAAQGGKSIRRCPNLSKNRVDHEPTRSRKIGERAPD